MPMDATLIPPLPASAMSPQAVEEQLQRLLQSPLFSHSRRSPGFLRHVVDEALKGHQNHLKERSIGIDVFQRVPDYDLNADPVVRVTAGEVRKRLAQYYYEAEHKDELRIELKPGSYVPEFKLVAEPSKPAPDRTNVKFESTVPALIEIEQSATDSTSSIFGETLPTTSTQHLDPARVASKRQSLWLAVSLTVIGCAIFIAVGVALYRARTPSALDSFWQPVWNSTTPVLISVGSWETPSSSEGDVSIGTHAKSSDPIALSDTVTIASMQQLLSQHGKASQIQSSAQTTFSDLQHGTTILISGFDNPWTMRLTAPLRFHFVARTPDLLTIEDKNIAGLTAWQIDTRTPYAQLTKDYGIVARFYDPTTEQNIVVAAGIGENGTLAAGKLLTNEQFLQDAAKDAGLTKGYHNIEAVVETLVINGKSGPPRVVALTTW
jgi:hypothetical protein